MKAKNRIFDLGSGLFFFVAIMGASTKNALANDVEIKASVKAVCTIAVTPLVDFGDIPITEFAGKSAHEEINGYDKSFTITPSCMGTTNYVLTFTPVKSSGGCLESTSQELAFCLYNSAGTKIELVETGATLQKETSAGAENIKIVPARATNAPTAGEHSGTMTVTIAPS